MNRLDVYSAVHKMQRARLFRLTIDAGKTDPADTVARAELAAAVDALAEELVAHAEHEERFIHPLLRACAPRLADALEAAHVELDSRLQRLQEVAAGHAPTLAGPEALYRALAAFTATYLEHLAVEESEALPALWEHCSDDELMSILTGFKGSRSEAENLTSLLAQLATLNPSEIARMVTAGLAPGSTSQVPELLATVLDPRQLGALRATVLDPRQLGALRAAWVDLPASAEGAVGGDAVPGAALPTR